MGVDGIGRDLSTSGGGGGQGTVIGPLTGEEKGDGIERATLME